MSSAIDDASVERPNDTAAASFERVFADPGKRRDGMIGLGNMARGSLRLAVGCGSP